MTTIDERILDYILAQTRFDDPLLAEMEARAQAEGFPIIGPLVGPWLYTLSRLVDARRIFELGSGYGYSTWYFCKAVMDGGAGTPAGQMVDGASSSDPNTEGPASVPAATDHSSAAGPVVVHTVWDAQLSADARANMGRAGFSELVRFIEGEAVAALRDAEDGWDVIFMDIDKEGYPGALPVIEAKLRPGGLLLVDNILWSGTVVPRRQPSDPDDQRPSTVAIRQLTTMLRDSPRWELLILPLRDGVAVARFRG